MKFNMEVRSGPKNMKLVFIFLLHPSENIVVVIRLLHSPLLSVSFALLISLVIYGHRCCP
jgi:hypothetical protein